MQVVSQITGVKIPKDEDGLVGNPKDEIKLEKEVCNNKGVLGDQKPVLEEEGLKKSNLLKKKL